MAELRDARVPGERHRTGDGLLLADQFQPVAPRVVEPDTRRDLAAAASPRATVQPAPSSSASAAASASSSATLNPDAMTPERPSTSARQWWRRSARRCAMPFSVGPASSSPTISVANVTAFPRSATPERTYAMSISSIMVDPQAKTGARSM
jgi:hypothetical protein